MNTQLQFDRAAMAWEKLIKHAEDKTKLSYKDLGQYIKAHHRVVRYPLDLIQKYCINSNLPPLTILVVDRNGAIGKGFIQQDNVKNLERKVFDFNWDRIANPFHRKTLIKKSLCEFNKEKIKSADHISDNIILQTCELPSYLFINKSRILKQPDQYINLMSEKYNNLKFRNFEIINEFYLQFPNWRKTPIQRNDVINLFKENKIYLGFISAMIWGGINASRPKEKNNFESIDFYRLLKMNRHKVENIINQVKKYLIEDEIKDCFIYLKKEGKIDGIDYPYFTKLMYFLGQSNPKIKTKPLIFDKWTSNAYLALLINSNSFQKVKSFYTGRVNEEQKLVGIRNPIQEVYLQYVLDMNKWSKQIGITSSKLEEFIFGTSLKIDKSIVNPRNELWKIIINNYK